MIEAIPNLLIIPVGLVIGFVVAAPVGPVNVLCIQRALERGILPGIVVGLGAVFGDGLVALSAALGVGFITGMVETYRFAIQLIGGLVLLAFGWQLYNTEPVTNGDLKGNPDGNGNDNGGVRHWDIARSFFLTVSNPGAVLGLFTIIGGISSFVDIGGTADALLLVGAIMCGNLAWWVGLSSIVARIRHKLSLKNLRSINVIAGLALVAFGAVLLGELVLRNLVL